MTRRLVFVTILASAVACAGVWPFGKKDKAAAEPKSQTAKAEQPKSQPKGKEPKASKETAAKGFDTLYTKGTVAAIPQYTSGKLDLSDRTALSFSYGKPTWTLPYAKIVNIEVADKRPPEILHVPYLQKRKRIVTIGFDNDRGVRQSVEMEIGLEAALSVLPLLEERSGKTAVVEGVQSADGWWGDRYWKTANNAQKWDDAANGTQKAKAVAQAKD